MLALHHQENVFSLRHLPSWVLLSLAAGSVNAAAFLDADTFVSHVTGTATRIGLATGRWTVELELFGVLLCFILGAMASVLAVDGRYYRGKRPLYAAPLITVVGLLCLVAFLGHLGMWGPFGGQLDQPRSFAMFYVLSFAMGLQNAAVATSTGMVVRTTHLTGPATDLGIHLATLIFARGEPRRLAGRGALLRSGKVVAFITGGIVVLPLADRLGHLVFLVPAVFATGALLLSFVPSMLGERPSSSAPPPPQAQKEKS